MNPLIRFGIFCLMAAGSLYAQDRPHILWITSEDNSPYLGCYGDEQALTPNLDRLAAEGVRYRNAFSNAPVCSTARSTLILGMHASTSGLQHHRSRVRVPDSFRTYPEVLREAGYYCTNNAKTDYNFANKRQPWDESSNKAHYRNRPEGQPFFAIFNLTTSHESQIQHETVAKRRKSGELPAEPRIAPEDFQLPPYHPDTPLIRRSWSDYYDTMTLMDKQVGKLLEDLEKDGLAEDTIVFYFADHGGALPRGKRNIHDSGTRVPLIVRFPEKWAHLAPAKAGEWVDQPVAFVDFPATLFSLVGAEAPEHYEGVPFLGAGKAEPRDHVFLFRGRMDERYDTVRAIRDQKYLYVRNFSPHRPWGQHYSYPFQVQPGMQSWYDAWKAGETNAVQSRYWETKPAEELYLISEDPYQINNLIEDPEHSAAKTEMRQELNVDMLSMRDTGLIPERMAEELAGTGTIHEYVRSGAWPAEEVLQTANMAIGARPDSVEHLAEAMQHDHPAIRYWGATGCLLLREEGAPATEALRQMLRDEYADNRIVAAEALSWLGEAGLALDTIRESLESQEGMELLAALNALDFMIENGNVELARGQELLKARKSDFKKPASRISDHLLSQSPQSDR